MAPGVEMRGYVAVLLLFATGILAVVGYFVLVVPGRDNPSLCVRRVMHWLGCGGFLFGGLFGLSEYNKSVAVCAVAGFIIGTVVGLFVGVLVWLRLRAVGREEGS